MTLRLAFAVFALTALPALSAGISVDLPNLTFPQPAPTVSTSGCEPAPADCPARP